MSHPDTESATQSTRPSVQSFLGLPKIAVDYIQMVGFNILVAGLSFLTTSFLLTYWGRSQYGEIVSLTSTTLMLTILGGDWTVQAMVRYGTEDFLESGRVRRIFWNRFYLAITGTLILILTSPVWASLLKSQVGFSGLGIVFILIYLPAQMFWTHTQRILPAIQRHKWRYPLLTLERLIVILSALILWRLNLVSLNTILPAYIIGSLVPGIVAIWIIRHQIGRPIWPEKAILSRIWNYSWPLIPTSMVGLMSTNALDYLFLRKYSGLAELGVYALGVQISGLVQQVPLIAGELTTPRFVKYRLNQDDSAFNHFIQNQLRFIFWIWSFCCLVGAAGVAFAGSRAIPDKYQVLCQLVWPLAAVTSIVPVWYIVWTPLLTAFERVRVVMWSSVATGIMNILMNFLLIPRFGLIGCAWATVISYATTSLFAEFWIQYTKDTMIPKRGIHLYMPSATLILLIVIIRYTLPS